MPDVVSGRWKYSDRCPQVKYQGYNLVNEGDTPIKVWVIAAADLKAPSDGRMGAINVQRLKLRKGQEGRVYFPATFRQPLILDVLPGGLSLGEVNDRIDRIAEAIEHASLMT